MTDDMEADSTR